MNSKDLDSLLQHLPKMRPSVKLRLKLAVKLRWAAFCQRLSLGIRFRVLAPRLAASAVSLVVVVALGITTLYAYSSPSVTNQSGFLYDLKNALEEVRLQLAFSDEDKVRAYLALAGRRAEEARVLARQGHIDTYTILQIQDRHRQAVAIAREIRSAQGKLTSKEEIAVAAFSQSQSLEEVKEIGVTLEAAAQQVEAIDTVSAEDLIVVSGALPEDGGLSVQTTVLPEPLPTPSVATLPEEQLIESSPELMVLAQVIETVEDNSDTDKLDVLLKLEDPPVIVSDPVPTVTSEEILTEPSPTTGAEPAACTSNCP